MDQALVFQAVQGHGGGAGLAQQILHGQFFGRAGHVEDFQLALAQFGHGFRRGQGADEELFAPAFLFLAHRLRQDAFEGDFRRAAIVLGQPARQFQDFGGDVRLASDGFDDGAQVGMRRICQQGGHAAQHLALGEGHFDTGADFDDVRQFIGDEVIELFAQGQIKRHARNHADSKPETGPIKKAKRP